MTYAITGYGGRKQTAIAKGLLGGTLTFVDGTPACQFDTGSGVITTTDTGERILIGLVVTQPLNCKGTLNFQRTDSGDLDQAMVYIERAFRDEFTWNGYNS
jgi:hypothetical protein